MRERTALIVVDVQLGAFDGELCPVISGSDQLLTNVAHLIDAARTSNIDVVFIQHCAPAGEVFEEGTARWQIHPNTGPIKGESIVTKHESSGFCGTNLHDILQTLDINTLVVCGLQSEHCVSNTALSALGLGYAVASLRMLMLPASIKRSGFCSHRLGNGLVFPGTDVGLSPLLGTLLDERLSRRGFHPNVTLAWNNRFSALQVAAQGQESKFPAHTRRSWTVLLPMFFTRFVLAHEML